MSIENQQQIAVLAVLVGTLLFDTASGAEGTVDQSERQLTAESTRHGYRVVNSGDVEALLSLVESMKKLSCIRREELLCDHMDKFGRGAFPTFKTGRTMLAGWMSYGTSKRSDRLGVCVINSHSERTEANCSYIYPHNDLEQYGIQKFLERVERDDIDTSSDLWNFLNTEFLRLPTFPTGEQNGGAVYMGPGGNKGASKVPTIIRQRNGVYYAATVQFVRPPRSFDDYPTLTFSSMKVMPGFSSNPAAGR